MFSKLKMNKIVATFIALFAIWQISNFGLFTKAFADQTTNQDTAISAEELPENAPAVIEDQTTNENQENLDSQKSIELSNIDPKKDVADDPLPKVLPKVEDNNTAQNQIVLQNIIQQEVWTGSLLINNADQYTNSLQVSLSILGLLGSDNADQMKFKNSGDDWPIQWEPYATTKVWSLSIGNDGARTVFVQFQKNSSLSPEYSDTILLDATPPILGIVSDGISGEDLDYTNSGTQLSAHWSGFADPGSGIDKFLVSVGTTPQAANVADWTDVGLANFITFHFFALSEGQYFINLRAQDIAGNWSNITSSDGIIVDLTPPTKPADVVYSGPGNPGYATTKALKFGWQAALDEVGIGGYEIKIYNEVADLILNDTIGNLTTYQVSSTDAAKFTENQKFYAEVAALDLANNKSEAQISSAVLIDTILPPVPTNLVAKPGDGFVDLSWESPIDLSGIDYFKIYRAASPFKLIATGIRNTLYRDNDVTNGIKYYYKVTAVDLAGNESFIDLTSLVSAVSVTPSIIGGVLAPFGGGEITAEAAKIARKPGLVSTALAESEVAAEQKKVEGEQKKEEVQTSPAQPAQEKEEGKAGKNWPMIVAIIIAVLVVVFGVWYYWVLSIRADEYIESKPRGRPRSRRKR